MFARSARPLNQVPPDRPPTRLLADFACRVAIAFCPTGSGLGRLRMKWKKFDPYDTSTIPNSPGVYVIFCYGIVMYVGSSRRMSHRMAQHFQTADRFSCTRFWPAMDSLTGKYCESEKYADWLTKEARLIRKLSPHCNVIHVLQEAE